MQIGPTPPQERELAGDGKTKAGAAEALGGRGISLAEPVSCLHKQCGRLRGACSFTKSGLAGQLPVRRN